MTIANEDDDDDVDKPYHRQFANSLQPWLASRGRL